MKAPMKASSKTKGKPFVRYVPIDPATENKIIKLKTEGLVQSEIAKATGVSVATVSRCLSRTARRAVLSLGAERAVFGQSHAEVQARIHGEAGPSVARIVKLRDGAYKEDVRLKAATDLLDRAGYKPIERSVSVSFVESMSGSELKEQFGSLLQRVLQRTGEVRTLDANFVVKVEEPKNEEQVNQ
jgi:transposase